MFNRVSRNMIMAHAVVLSTICALGTTCSRNELAQVYFSPTKDREAERAVCNALAGASDSVRVAMYSFTRRPIREELVRAKGRGVDVEVILDRQQASSKFSEWKDLQAAGIPVHFSENANGGSRGCMHHKYAVIDGGVVLTGSFNWTGNAVGFNQENVVLIRSKQLASEYLANWKQLPRNDAPPNPKGYATEDEAPSEEAAADR